MVEGGCGRVCVCVSPLEADVIVPVPRIHQQTTQPPPFPKHTPQQEIVFRACMLPLLRASLGHNDGDGNDANAPAILLSPLLFGVAHLHHGWQRVVREGVPVRFFLCVWC